MCCFVFLLCCVALPCLSKHLGDDLSHVHVEYIHDSKVCRANQANGGQLLALISSVCMPDIREFELYPHMYVKLSNSLNDRNLT